MFTSDATARLDLPDCTVEDDEAQDPDPAPPVPGEPAEPVVKHIDCGGLQTDIEVDPEGPVELDLPDAFIAQLIGESHAKLVD